MGIGFETWWILIGVVVFLVGQILISLWDEEFESRVLVVVAAVGWPVILVILAAFGVGWVLLYGLPLGLRDLWRSWRIALRDPRLEHPPVAEPRAPAAPYRSPAPSCKGCGRPLP